MIKIFVSALFTFLNRCKVQSLNCFFCLLFNGDKTHKNLDFIFFSSTDKQLFFLSIAQKAINFCKEGVGVSLCS